MCSYNVKIDDLEMEVLRPTITSGMAEDAWVQLQVEMLFSRMAEAQRNAIVSKAREAVYAMRTQSEENGNSNMTLDDINEEIRLSRQERRAVKQ